jgi:hypothetical protein
MGPGSQHLSVDLFDQRAGQQIAVNGHPFSGACSNAVLDQQPGKALLSGI